MGILDNLFDFNRDGKLGCFEKLTMLSILDVTGETDRLEEDDFGDALEEEPGEEFADDLDDELDDEDA
ncbi:MAG TPA: hypothetical protein VN540_07005 [Clostridia bacterium]|nr:hypothetical protein [Clostridia bacterium]